MAPPKKNQKMSLGDFLGDQTLGSWADEMEDMPVAGGGSGGGFGGERRTYGSGGGFGSDRGFGGADRIERGGYAVREQLPLPSKPPYTAHLGNLSFDATEGDINDFFGECEVTNVRIVEDKLDRKPKGFGYVEFGSLDGLKKALDLSGTQFQGRNIRVSVAEPPKDRPEGKDMSDWTRKGPLPDLPGQNRRASDRGNFRNFEAASDAGSERGGAERGERRRPPPFADDGKMRDMGNWERKGPLSPAPTGPPREGGRVRSNDGPRTERKQSPAPAWGEGRQDGGSRPPRREFQEKPAFERQPTAPELDNQWRSKMRPDAAAKSPTATPDASVPSSPAPQPAAPATRPKLNLQKRTVSEAVETPITSASDSKSNPFGAARPADTAAREREVIERKELAIRQKKDADDKAREEKKAKETSEKAAAKEASGARAEKGEAEEAEKPAAGNTDALASVEEGEEAGKEEGGIDASANGEIVQDKAVKPKEVVRDPPKSDGGSWRRKSSTPAGGPPAGSTTKGLEDDGWSTVPAKSNKSKGRGNGGRAIAS